MCFSRSGLLPDISSVSICQLSAMPAEVLRLHLANHHLITTGTKITMARRLFDAIHSASSTITAKPFGASGTVIKSCHTIICLPTTINSHQLGTSIFSVAQHNPIITLPITLAAPVTHVPPLHPQENEDALSTVSDVPPPATTRPCQRTDSSLLLPPVPT